MPKEEQLVILKQGVKKWNQWRRENSSLRPDLRGAVLREADLHGANFRGANLTRANLTRANLRGAVFSAAVLHRANLNRANLRGAVLHRANLRRADLRDVDLTRADLSEADLSETVLRNAHLREADLRNAHLSEADLSGANLSASRCGYTDFGNVDLSQVKGLESVEHQAPSYIDIRTIYRSDGNIPEAFLCGAGVPDNFITFMKSLTTAAFDFYSCFISHSSKDREFVERLYADLQSNGVRCWYAPHDLAIGEPFLSGIDRGIRLHDKLLLILSEHSVNSRWVEHEVLSATTKEYEQGRGTIVLFPVRLDDTVMDTDVPWAKTLKGIRHIADFTQWKDHDSYKKAFDRLLRDLKGKP